MSTFNQEFTAGIGPTTAAQVTVGPDSVDVDLTSPDGQSVIWPLPRSMKIDMAQVLIAVFEHFSLDVPVITTGAFHPQMMRDNDFVGRPVVVLQRGADRATHEALGNLTQVITATDVETGQVLGDDALLAAIGPDTEIFLKHQASNEVVDIWLFDENDQRVEQLYLLVKTALFAAEKTMLETLGYLEFLRADGQDSTTMVSSGSGGEFVVFQRFLQYTGKHLDFIAGIEQVARLVAEQYTETADASDASLSVDL